MYNIIIAGKTGEGKSEVIKRMIKGKPCYVFDLYNEYGLRTKYKGQKPINLTSKEEAVRSRHIGGDFYKFAEKTLTKENTVVVFEEATGFLNGRIDKIFRKIITNKMFTNNVYIFVFHTITDIPPSLMRLTDYIVLFKTLDERYNVEKKYPRLLQAFDKLKSMETGSSIKLKLD